MKNVIGYTCLLLFLFVPSSSLAQTYVDWDITVIHFAESTSGPFIDVDLEFLHKPSNFRARAPFRNIDPSSIKSIARDQIARYERVFAAKTTTAGKIDPRPANPTIAEVEESNYANDVNIWRSRKAALDAGMPENALVINALFNDLKTRYRPVYARYFR